MTNPAALLREAAAKVRAASARAVGAPWEMTWSEDGDGQWEIGDWDGNGLNWSRYAATGEDDGTAEWIALASPEIAEPLAAWLDWAAVLSDYAVENGGPGDLPGMVPALDVAKALLGEDAS